MIYNVYAKICCPNRSCLREVEANSKSEAHGKALEELNMPLLGKTTKIWEVVRVELKQ